MTTSNAIHETLKTPSPKWRRASPWWLQLIGVLVVFAAGTVTGSMITSRVIHSRMEEYRQQAPIFSQDIVFRLRTRLALSDAQATQIQQIVEKRHAQMIKHRNNGSQQMHTEFETMIEEVASELDDDQTHRWRGIAEHVRRTYLPVQTGN